MCPTFRSCNISPATAEEMQTTAATPSTAATPCIPETPISTIRSAEMTRAASVSPEIGLLDEPISPTRLPDTAAKKKPTIIITIAATMPGPQAAGVALVQKDHADQHHQQSAEYELGVEIAFGAGGTGVSCGGLLQVGHRSRHARAQALTHTEQGEAGANQHASNGDRPTIKLHTAPACPAQNSLSGNVVPAGTNCVTKVGPPRNKISGTSRPHAMTPPAKFNDARRGPMM